MAAATREAAPPSQYPRARAVAGGVTEARQELNRRPGARRRGTAVHKGLGRLDGLVADDPQARSAGSAAGP